MAQPHATVVILIPGVSFFLLPCFHLLALACTCLHLLAPACTTPLSSRVHFSGEEISSDALPINGYEQCKAADYGMFSCNGYNNTPQSNTSGPAGAGTLGAAAVNAGMGEKGMPLSDGPAGVPLAGNVNVVDYGIYIMAPKVRRLYVSRHILWNCLVDDGKGFLDGMPWPYTWHPISCGTRSPAVPDYL